MGKWKPLPSLLCLQLQYPMHFKLIGMHTKHSLRNVNLCMAMRACAHLEINLVVLFAPLLTKGRKLTCSDPCKGPTVNVVCIQLWKDNFALLQHSVGLQLTQQIYFPFTSWLLQNNISSVDSTPEGTRKHLSLFNKLIPCSYLVFSINVFEGG